MLKVLAILLLYAVVCDAAAVKPWIRVPLSDGETMQPPPNEESTVEDTNDDSVASRQLDLKQDHRNLQTCEEDDAFFVIMSCFNVCGVNGLEFKAEKTLSICEFVSDSQSALDEARALGCSNVGGNFACSYADLEGEIDDGNLDIMCELFCPSFGSDPTPPPVNPTLAPLPPTVAPVAPTPVPVGPSPPPVLPTVAASPQETPAPEPTLIATSSSAQLVESIVVLAFTGLSFLSMI